jgi:bifunctional DNA-binding transcriptional regulator/antitoxin component of YhaV-PrlF toxin-antitoxin module
MEIVRLGKKGQLSLPKAILKRSGLAGQELLLVDTAPDGSIVLKPAGVYLLELYGNRRVAEFLKEDRPSLSDRQEARQEARPPQAPLQVSGRLRFLRRVFLDANVIFAAALSKDGRAAGAVPIGRRGAV